MRCKTVEALAFAVFALGAGADSDALRDGFVSPPASARPHVWWHWMNGNVTKEGITADLEAMARAGIGGAQIFDVSDDIPAGNITFCSEAWYDMLCHANEEAKRLGIELALSNCSGWSSSGGPWVRPEDSMKHVVYAETVVRGGERFNGSLPEPENTHGFYRDLAILAFPRPAAESVDPADYGMRSSFKPGDCETTVTFNKPFPLSGIAVDFDVAVRHTDAVLKVDVSEDGTSFRTAVEGFTVYPARYGDRDDAVFVPVDAGFVLAVKVACDLAVCTQMPGLVVDGVKSLRNKNAKGLASPHQRVVGIRPEARLRIPEFNAKIFNFRSKIHGYPYDAKSDQIVDCGRIINLTSRRTADGSVDWIAPEGGDWVLARFGYASNGAYPRPTTEGGKGLEVDKLSKEALSLFFAGYVDKVLARLGPVSPKGGLNNVLVDSWEVGCQNWTDGFERLFKERKGYDIIPWLPVLSGRIVGSPRETENVLADFRRVISDLFVENYAGEFQRLCHARGLLFSLEGYGSSPGDDMRYARRCDVPMGEFWAGNASAKSATARLGGTGNCRFPGFIAHVWGQRFVGAEAFTSAQGERWNRDPFAYKAQGDRAFCQGINRIIYHRWAHQPWTNPSNYPGMTMGPHGSHFERTQTWWEDAAPAWLMYQSRCQWMLQEGMTAADVLVFSGDSPTNYGLDLSRWHDYGMVGEGVFGEGRQWDVCGGEAVLASRAENGEIVVPSGARYKAIGVLPRIVVDDASRAALDRLSAQGVPVVAADLVDQTLLDKGIMPDFECLTPSCAKEVRWIHRRMADGSEVYFVALPNEKPASFEAAFRVTGSRPEIWNPENGRITKPLSWREEGKRTVVHLDFNPSGAAFVVFRPRSTEGIFQAEEVAAESMAAVPVDGAWEVEFMDGRGAPNAPAVFDALMPWNKHENASIRHYSGSAIYRKTVSDPRTGNGRQFLDLGDVKNVATVTVNGKVYPVLWKPPFRLEITDAPAKDGKLDLSIRVTNMWPNRLIGDEAMPCDAEYGKDGGIVAIPQRVFDGKPSATGRHTFTTWRLWNRTDTLLPSGLIGPVRLLRIEAGCADGIADRFRAPPASARPQVWWHWMNGNVTKEGITADLEAMAAIGIGGAHIFDVDIGIPKGPIDFNTPAWFDHVRWAAHEAKRLGIELGLSNCSGFSSSGGPWVTPEDSMKKLVWTEVSVKGGAAGCGQPALPAFAETNGFYRDVAVLAFRAPMAVHLKDVSGKTVRREPLCVTVSFDEPFRATMLGMRLESQGWSDDCPVRVEVSDDGAHYRTILERRIFTRLSGKVDSTMRNLVLPDTTARHYRVTAMPRRGLAVTLHDIDLGRWGGLESLPLKTFAFKAERFSLSDLSERGRAEDGEAVADVLDLTDRLKPNGMLDWTGPEGEWRIVRFGCAATGVKVRPASPGGAGLETDKLNAESTRRHFNAYVGSLLNALGPEKDAIDTVLVDSYEVGAQNWTQGMERIFRERLGYAIVPYLPVFAGYVVRDVETSERFLADFRRLVADLFAENYGDEMARLCHAEGVKFSLEPHGDFASDDMRYGQDADIVIGNFWSGQKGTVNPGVERLVSSIAHVWGRRYVGSEAFTAQPKGWLRTPAFIKAQGDYAYTLGVNRIIYHRYAHQPWVNPSYVPGMTMGPWGMHFERTQTWWPLAKDWVTYQSRCQQMLQDGRFVADVVLFCGEEAPNSLKEVEKVPKGYGFDGCAAAAVKAMRVERGELVLPSGMRYRMLALPESGRMSLSMLDKIGSLVADGATVVGRKPEKAIGLAEGADADRRVKSRAAEIWNRGVLEMSVAEALRRKGIQPDFKCRQDGITSIHRKYGGGEDAYFVAWQGTTGATVRCSFRQEGRVPELWNPETGTTADSLEWRMHDGRTDVTLDFEPSGSVFVVFRRSANGVAGASCQTRIKTVQEQTLTGGWDVTFPPGWGAPEKLHLDRLCSWTDVPDDGVRYFSGSATYRGVFELNGVNHRMHGKGRPVNVRTILDLGDVREFAEVTVNGVSYPVLWKPPFRLDVTDAVAQTSSIEVSIRVTNLWVNRLIGDERLPPDREWKPGRKWLKEMPGWVKRGERSPTGRYTFTTWHHWTKDDKPVPSGLLGPVILRDVTQTVHCVEGAFLPRP